ncbi:hypothetical protein BASA50_003685 [Batrachochytrium salamandrivorans]|uniref:C3H1-type domain-containing protein n=1 Tax=Batrachochytrium salamandrivorans TaxID=1357716 RepID=A0ABQ8FI74_9FUNG|nr:hypothetical protein BASA50_003685 [Batrachochytrium salamandrivorans]
MISTHCTVARIVIFSLAAIFLGALTFSAIDAPEPRSRKPKNKRKTSKKNDRLESSNDGDEDQLPHTYTVSKPKPAAKDGIKATLDSGYSTPRKSALNHQPDATMNSPYQEVGEAPVIPEEYQQISESENMAPADQSSDLAHKTPHSTGTMAALSDLPSANMPYVEVGKILKYFSENEQLVSQAEMQDAILETIMSVENSSEDGRFNEFLAKGDDSNELGLENYILDDRYLFDVEMEAYLPAGMPSAEEALESVFEVMGADPNKRRELSKMMRQLSVYDQINGDDFVSDAIADADSTNNFQSESCMMQEIDTADTLHHSESVLLSPILEETEEEDALSTSLNLSSQPNTGLIGHSTIALDSKASNVEKGEVEIALLDSLETPEASLIVDDASEKEQDTHYVDGPETSVDQNPTTNTCLQEVVATEVKDIAGSSESHPPVEAEVVSVATMEITTDSFSNQNCTAELNQVPDSEDLETPLTPVGSIEIAQSVSNGSTPFPIEDSLGSSLEKDSLLPENQDPVDTAIDSISSDASTANQHTTDSLETSVYYHSHEDASSTWKPASDALQPRQHQPHQSQTHFPASASFNLEAAEFVPSFSMPQCYNGSAQDGFEYGQLEKSVETMGAIDGSLYYLADYPESNNEQQLQNYYGQPFSYQVHQKPPSASTSVSSRKPKKRSSKSSIKEKASVISAPTLADFFTKDALASISKNAKPIKRQRNPQPSSSDGDSAECTTKANTQSNSTSSIDATLQLDQDHKVVNSSNQMSVSKNDRIKCRFDGACNNKDNGCPYFHPTEVCIFYPNCKYGNGCTFTHPS